MTRKLRRLLIEYYETPMLKSIPKRLPYAQQRQCRHQWRHRQFRDIKAKWTYQCRKCGMCSRAGG